MMAIGLEFWVRLLAALLPMLAGNFSSDQLDLMDSRAYWELHEVPWTEAAMLEELRRIPGGEPEDLEKLIAGLGAEQFRQRREAETRLAELGDLARSALKAARQHPDPEIATRSARLLERMGPNTQAPDVRLLMAIRSAGELRLAAAHPQLTRLREHPDPFVAEYADQALARLAGDAWRRPPADPEREASDLRALPPNLAGVGRLRLNADPGQLDVRTALLELQPALNLLRPLTASPLQAYTRQLNRLAGRTGNFRVQTLTAGFTTDVSATSGCGVAILRGRFQPERLMGAVTETWPRWRRGWFAGQPGLTLDDNLALLFPGSEVMLVVVGPRLDPGLLEGLVKRQRDPPGQPGFPPRLEQLVTEAGDVSPGWTAWDLASLTRQPPALQAAGITELVVRLERRNADLGLEVRAGLTDAATARTFAASLDDQRRTMLLPMMETMIPLAPSAGDLLAALKTWNLSVRETRVQIALTAADMPHSRLRNLPVTMAGILAALFSAEGPVRAPKGFLDEGPGQPLP